ncbi:MAG: hypothetical protein ACRBB4_16070 [Neptuniibacter sp.]|uniref:hypothetical protein n=1 Tax=Neptuniibacter sp. TaxID=1962643 RepID=UPI003B5CAC4C
MERFKRKLTLLNIPVLEIKDLTELEEALLEFKKERRVTQSQAAIAGQNNESDLWKNSSEIPSLDLLLGVEESSILFTESEVFRDFVNRNENQLLALVLKKRHIVENIEVALYKINNGSYFYGKVLEILEPKDIPKNCIVLITKN